MIEPIEHDDPDFETVCLNERFARHCRNAYAPDAGERRWARAVARGLYVILRDRALAGDDTAAFGCPHFILYADEEGMV